ncbi:MAG: HAD-IB family phosphatase [Desulfurococcales archaeon]|nr:HAD-IB family phosphatase [Desulfurococcales archaeon]
MACIEMIVFDMDGVLVKVRSSWEYVHRSLGVLEEANKVKQLYEEGKIDYIKWMELDTKLWINASNGRLHISKLSELLDKVELMPGAVETSRTLHRMGKRIAIISGGIDLLAKRVARMIGADAWMANGLTFDKRGYLKPGGIPLVGTRKDRALKKLAGELGIKLDKIMYVGDSSWDAPAMKLVGYPVLFGDGDGDVVRSAAKYRITRLGELIDLIKSIEANCGKRD